MKIIIQLLLIFLSLSCKKETMVKSENNEFSHHTLPYFNTKDFTPEWNIPENKKHTIQDFQLVNQAGEKVDLKTFKNKILIVNFFFTSCNGICVKLMSNMRILQDYYKLDTNVKFLSHSVTPELDSPEVLNIYAKEKGVNSKQWHLVTASKDVIYKLARDSYFSDEDYNVSKKKSSFIHSENFLLIDLNGHIRGVYNGTNTDDMQLIKKHINTLKKELYDN